MVLSITQHFFLEDQQKLYVDSTEKIAFKLSEKCKSSSTKFVLNMQRTPESAASSRG